MAMKKSTKEIIVITSITAGVALAVNVIGRIWLDRYIVPRVKNSLPPAPTDSMQAGTAIPAAQGIVKENGTLKSLY